MEKMEKYFQKICNKYAGKIELFKRDNDEDKLSSIPDALRLFYKFASKAKFPYGEIFTIEEALKYSERKPFKPDWIVFGKDNYFSFWLCSIKPDDEGLSFTYWDHDSGSKIDGAVWEDLISFLEEMEKENGIF